MLLSASNNGTPTFISLASAELLFDPATNLSLLNDSPDSIMYWLRAADDHIGAEAQALLAAFDLVTSQLIAICNWRNASFIPPYVIPYIVQEANQYYPNATWGADIGWVQYVQAGFTGSNSISSLYSTWYPQFPSRFEIAPTVNISVASAMILFTGPYGILNVENFAVFMQMSTAPKSNYTNWNITASQESKFTNYIVGLAMTYTKPTVQALIQAGSGLITTHTVDYWLWTCNDPLLEYLLGPSLSYCGLQNNNTVQPPSQIWSGKDDLSKLGQYIAWRNQTTVPYWNEIVAVNGTTDNGQFPPYVKEGQVLGVWDENFVKTVYFNQNGTTQVSGIDTYVYVMNNSAFDASVLYTNTIQGFANETLVNQAPIFLSLWDLYLVDPAYANVSGMQPNSSDVTILYVEPTTGSTIQASMKLQINLFFGPNDNSLNEQFTQWAEVPDDQFYPLVKILQTSQIGEKDANMMKGELTYVGHKFTTGLLWGLVGLGIILALVGMVVLFRGVQHKKKHGYTEIQ
jgi:hypothetical protein